jgi:hypothetical protein
MTNKQYIRLKLHPANNNFNSLPVNETPHQYNRLPNPKFENVFRSISKVVPRNMYIYWLIYTLGPNTEILTTLWHFLGTFSNPKW